ncbi:hypothetical protein GCM10007932_56830 [Vibrio penaeicida]|uniref:Uncharacterized protein n=1 Tax=Vibrio penaeicida TaxID=104609 RepID=A0AAV5P042_9VIBR|nr:hypothetical protein GCM10007932_56830 [Vibrio penaeicida]
MLLSVLEATIGNENKSHKRDKVDISVKINNGRFIELTAYRSTNRGNYWYLYDFKDIYNEL